MPITKEIVLSCKPGKLKKVVLEKYLQAVDLPYDGTVVLLKHRLWEYIATEKRKQSEQDSSDNDVSTNGVIDSNQISDSTIQQIASSDPNDRIMALESQLAELMKTNNKSSMDDVAVGLFAVIKKVSKLNDDISKYDSDNDEHITTDTKTILCIKSKQDERRFNSYNNIEKLACVELNETDLQVVNYLRNTVNKRTFMQMFQDTFGNCEKFGIKEESRLLYWICDRLKIFNDSTVTIEQLKLNALIVMETCCRQIWRHIQYCKPDKPLSYQSTMNVLPQQLHSNLSH